MRIARIAPPDNEWVSRCEASATDFETPEVFFFIFFLINFQTPLGLSQCTHYHGQESLSDPRRDSFLPRLRYRLMLSIHLLCICHQSNAAAPDPIPKFPHRRPGTGTSRGRGQVGRWIPNCLLYLCVCSSRLHKSPGQKASEKSVTGLIV